MSDPSSGSQLTLFTTWDYHAFVTNRPGELVEVEANHRRHAVIEQRIAELKSAGLAHLPSGKFMANAAWLALAVMAHSFGRAVGRLAGPDREKATVGTLQQQIFTVPGRLVHSGRRRYLRLPASWPWARRSPGPHHDPSDPAALLTNSLYPYDQDLGEAGRPAGSPYPGPLEPMLTQIPNSAIAHSRPGGGSRLRLPSAGALLRVLFRNRPDDDRPTTGGDSGELCASWPFGSQHRHT